MKFTAENMPPPGSVCETCDLTAEQAVLNEYACIHGSAHTWRTDEPAAPAPAPSGELEDVDPADALSMALARAEEELERHDFTSNASVKLPHDRELHWMKRGRAWGVFIRRPNGDLTSVYKTNRAERIAAAHALGDLFRACEDAREKMLGALVVATEKVEQFLRFAKGQPGRREGE